MRTRVTCLKSGAIHDLSFRHPSPKTNSTIVLSGTFNSLLSAKNLYKKNLEVNISITRTSFAEPLDAETQNE